MMVYTPSKNFIVNKAIPRMYKLLNDTKVWYQSKAKKYDVQRRCSTPAELFLLKKYYQILSCHAYWVGILYVHFLTSSWCMINVIGLVGHLF